MGRTICCLVSALALAACNNAVNEATAGGTGTGGGNSSSGGNGTSGGSGPGSSSGGAGSSGAGSNAGSSSGGAGSSGNGSSGGVSGGASGGASGGTSGGASGGGACTADAQCPSGDYCNYTVSPCGGLEFTDTEVPGSCEPNCGTSCGGCTSDADCGPDENCVNGICQQIPVCSCAFPGPCDTPCALVTAPHDCCGVCLCPSCPSGGTSGGVSGGSTGGGTGGCASGGCGFGESCCPSESRCVDLQYDTQNCGACGTACPSGDICEAANCVAALCSVAQTCTSSDTCCGSSCCGGSQICCYEAGGPVQQYPYVCVDADAGCPLPCLACADPE
jgi:hypothetical protein